MLTYAIGFILLGLGFFFPPIGGYEQIFLIIGAFLIFKQIRKI